MVGGAPGEVVDLFQALDRAGTPGWPCNGSRRQAGSRAVVPEHPSKIVQCSLWFWHYTFLEGLPVHWAEWRSRFRGWPLLADILLSYLGYCGAGIGAV